MRRLQLVVVALVGGLLVVPAAAAELPSPTVRLDRTGAAQGEQVLFSVAHCGGVLLAVTFEDVRGRRFPLDAPAPAGGYHAPQALGTSGTYAGGSFVVPDAAHDGRGRLEAVCRQNGHGVAPLAVGTSTGRRNRSPAALITLALIVGIYLLLHRLRSARVPDPTEPYVVRDKDAPSGS